jgi:glutathione peroxidase
MTRLTAIVVLAVLAGCNHPSTDANASAQAPSPAPTQAAPSIHDLTVRTIEGREQSLGAYAGQVLLIVNTASACGFTPQYSGLEQLHQRYHARGFEVLGFPSNDFGAQEPGTDAEIAEFCRSHYGVTFPMFSKSVVHGAASSALYKRLSAQHGEPEWNFHKYLIDGKGRIIAAFPSKVAPDSPLLTGAIEQALGGS